MWDNAALFNFRIGLGYGSISFPIKPCHLDGLILIASDITLAITGAYFWSGSILDPFSDN